MVSEFPTFKKQCSSMRQYIEELELFMLANFGDVINNARKMAALITFFGEYGKAVYNRNERWKQRLEIIMYGYVTLSVYILILKSTHLWKGTPSLRCLWTKMRELMGTRPSQFPIQFLPLARLTLFKGSTG